jgi:Rrf2 family protein
VKLTRESEYALRGLVRLASYPPGALVSHSEIAEAEQLPPAFLAKIFQKLARHGVLLVERGRGSGYTLRASPEATRVRDVLEAVEGPQALDRCLLWGRHCSETAPCPLHHRLKPLRARLDEVLSETTLADFANGTPELPHPAIGE